MFNTSHDHSHIFSNDELFQLTPEHIYGFLADKVFGTSSPSEDCKPTYGRASSMEFTKKAISFYMPNRLMKWDVQNRSRNPTKSVLVNKLIKRVKKHKVRKEGVSSKARHAMELPKILEVVKRCRKLPEGHFGRLTGSAYFFSVSHDCKTGRR